MPRFQLLLMVRDWTEMNNSLPAEPIIRAVKHSPKGACRLPDGAECRFGTTQHCLNRVYSPRPSFASIQFMTQVFYSGIESIQRMTQMVFHDDSNERLTQSKKTTKRDSESIHN